MFAQPLTPNLADYVSFLYGVVEIPPQFLPSALGTATGGDFDTLIDATANWTPDQWDGFYAVDLTLGQTALIGGNDSQMLSFAQTQPNAVNAGDAYLIEPGSISMTFNVAREIVSPTLAFASAQMYALAVYNLAADRLVNYAPDVTNQTYFKDLRGPDKFRIADPIMGVVAGSSNESNSTTLLNPEQMKRLTLGQLQNLKTPWGREYLSIAQSLGVNIWGLN